MKQYESVGERFDLDLYLSAQNLCRDIVHRIAAQVGPMMSEVEGQALIREEFLRVGVTKFWHPSKFRIGKETVKSFRELPDDSVRLEAGDIFFLDVGPIIDGHEADCGKTFVLHGPDESSQRLHSLADASREIWSEAADQWRKHGLSGVGLFEFAECRAKSKGFQLNPLMAGHRLGDFPHALFSKEKLFSIEAVPTENLWVLEIHIIDFEAKRGAFFEDILC